MLRPIYEQHEFPIFQNRMYDSVNEARSCPKGDIRLVEDLRTGLIYNEAFQPEKITYDVHYQNEQAFSGTFKKHLDEMANRIGKYMNTGRLVEVGCGKGYFLELLLDKGFDITGYDPAYEGHNSRIRKEYFNPDSTERADGLILRHVLEHVPNPVDFLFKLKAANRGAGLIYIEVPCFDWIVNRCAWYDIFYEHVNYFRLHDLKQMFGELVDYGHVFSNQYMYVIARLSSLRIPGYDPSTAIQFPKSFAQTAMAPLETDTGASAVWGGASKGAIFCLLKSRSGHSVDYVIDINPSKQGKYLPATGIQISSPDYALKRLPPGSTIYVMNSNYSDEIRAMSNNAFRYIEIDHE